MRKARQTWWQFLCNLLDKLDDIPFVHTRIAAVTNYGLARLYMILHNELLDAGTLLV